MVIQYYFDNNKLHVLVKLGITPYVFEIRKWFYEIDCFQVYAFNWKVLRTLKSTNIVLNSKNGPICKV